MYWVTRTTLGSFGKLYQDQSNLSVRIMNGVIKQTSRVQKEKVLGCLAVVEKVNNYMEVARIENQSIGSRQFI